jgi:hypothetical protein
MQAYAVVLAKVSDTQNILLFRVSDLTMPGDPRSWQVEIRDIIRPEVPRQGGNRFEQELCGFRRRLHPGAQVETV